MSTPHSAAQTQAAIPRIATGSSTASSRFVSSIMATTHTTGLWAACIARTRSLDADGFAQQRLPPNGRWSYMLRLPTRG
jgi:hypothetical protein